MRITEVYVILLILFLFYSSGCSDSPVVSPIQTDNNGDREEVDAGQSHNLLGYYLLAIDTDGPVVEIVPVRSTDLHLNLTSILNGSMGVTASILPGESDPPNGLFVIDITLEHPFGTKPQFAGFDVKGILITPGSINMDAKLFADADETRLLNKDGLTRWWNPTEFTSPGLFGYTQGLFGKAPVSVLTAEVNPYKYFADELSATSSMGPVHDEPLDSDTGRGVFRAGNSNTRRYQISFPVDGGPQVVFGYAIDASWMAPSPNPPSEIPDDFPIEANMAEAYDINHMIDLNTLYYDSESGVGGGLLRMRANVYDWQGQMAGDIAGEIGTVRLFSPDMFTGSVTGSFVTEEPTKARYSFDLTGTAHPTHAGDTLVAIKASSVGGPSYNQGVGPAPSDNVAAWDTFVLDIPDPECQGDANNDWAEAVEVSLDDGVEGQVCLPDDYRDFYRFDMPMGYASGGSITLYCDAEPTTLGLYDSDTDLVTEADVSSGMAVIELDDVMMFPERYYLRIFTSNDTQVSPYYLELDVQLTDVTPSSPVDITPDGLYCRPFNLWKHENYLITVGTTGIWIFDVTDPENPVDVFNEEKVISSRADFCYPYIYYVDHGSSGDGIGMIDLTDIDVPVYHENIITFGYDLREIAITSQYIVALEDVEGSATVTLHDYSGDPTSPTLLVTDGVTCGTLPALALYVDPLNPDDPPGLVVSSYNEIRLYEESGGNYTLAESDSFPLKIRKIHIEGAYFYITTWDGTEGNLHIAYYYSTTWQQKGSVGISTYPSYLDKEGDHVYISGKNVMHTVDVSDKNVPVLIASNPVPSYGYAVDADGDYVYQVIGEAGFNIFDVSYPPSPDMIYRSPVINNPRQAVIIDDVMFVADTDLNIYNSIDALDISDPSSTHVISELILPDANSQLACKDNYLYSNTGSYDVVVIDAGDPTDLSIVDSFEVYHYIYIIAVRGNTLYITTGDAKVYIYDITDPSSPSYVTVKTYTANIGPMAFSGNYMYSSTSDDLVEIFSLSNPHNPVSLGTYTPAGEPRELATEAGYLYICNKEVFEIADISDPAAPVYQGSLLMPEYNTYYSLATDGLFGYLTGGYIGQAVPLIASLWPPDSPSEIYTFTDWEYGGGKEILINEGYMYVMSAYGIRIFDLY